jgi:hypothetical protein
MELKIYNAMMKCSYETFYLSFLNAMIIQKCKHAKVKIYAMLKSKYGKLPMLPLGEGLDF